MPKGDKVNEDLFGRIAMRAYVRMGLEGRREMREKPVERGMYVTNRGYIPIDESSGIGIPAWSKLIVCESDAEAQLIKVWWPTGLGGHYIWLEPSRLMAFDRLPLFGTRQ